jgi:hypothetical protein
LTTDEKRESEDVKRKKELRKNEKKIIRPLTHVVGHAKRDSTTLLLAYIKRDSVSREAQRIQQRQSQRAMQRYR